MMIEEGSEPMVRGLDQLRVLTPDEQRAARLRAQCRAQLTRRASARKVEPALLAGFCFLYLSAIVHDVLRVRGMF